jgi:hypothetical protein
MTQASAKLQTCYRQKCPIRSEDIQIKEYFTIYTESVVRREITSTLASIYHAFIALKIPSRKPII